jgi:hypothetical protein
MTVPVIGVEDVKVLRELAQEVARAARSEENIARKERRALSVPVSEG